MTLAVTACDGKIPPPSDSGSGDNEKVALNLLEVNNYFRSFTQAIKNSAPDIPLNIEYYSGSNPTNYIKQKLASNVPPDIVYFGSTPSPEFQQQYLMDLSSYDFLKNYNLSLVNQRDVNGALYVVPANYLIICMMYNKTLFKGQGWKVPTTHGELVALCKQIGGIPYLDDTPEQQFLNFSVNNIGISKKLSEPGNEKKLEAAIKVMSIFPPRRDKALFMWQ